jgi:hypothetical protein
MKEVNNDLIPQERAIVTKKYLKPHKKTVLLSKVKGCGKTLDRK